MSKLLSRLKSNWSACFSALMKPKATRSSRIVSCRTKTKLAVERCEPRLALDASQPPEDPSIFDGVLEVGQPAARAQTFDSGVGLLVVPAYLNTPVMDLSNLSTDGDGITNNGITNRVIGFLRPTNFSNRAVVRSLWDQTDVTLTENLSINGRSIRLGLVDELASGEITGEDSSKVSMQGSLALPVQLESTEVSSVGEKQPKASNEGSSLTTSLLKHHHTDPAVLHVSSLQTISFESAKPVFHADQAFTVLASNDGAQIAMPQSKMARGEPSSTGFLDVQATIAGIDSAQKTLFEPVVFDNENGSSLFEENVHQDNTNSMPVMARATLFEVAEHRVPPLPREVLHGYDGDVKTAGGEKVVASPTLPHDMLVASGDSDDWASSDLSLNVRLFLVAAFATTTFELDKRYRSNDFSINNANDTNAKQKCLLR